MGLWERIHKDERPAGPSVGEAVETAKQVQREVWARPGRCPVCGGRGYLDRIDVVDRVMDEHCTECFHTWQVHESETQPAT